MDVNDVLYNQVFLPNRTLKIPYFQRAYVWDEKNWEKFYTDIADTAIRNKEENANEIYFIGSIILKKNSEKQVFDVIDGQQRLTTIVLFMKALYLCIGHDDLFRKQFMTSELDDDFNENITPILIPNCNDRSTYNTIIQKEIAQIEPIDDTNMARGFAYFVDRILKSKSGEDMDYPVSPKDILDTIKNYVKLVSIEVGKEENAQKIFETINCTGIKLTTGEMLKNFLYDENSIEEYEKTWMKVFEGRNFSYWNDGIVLGRLESNHINNFFYRYMQILMQNPVVKEKLTPSEVKSYRKQDGLFEKFVRLVERNNGISKEEMTAQVVDCAKLYMDTFKKEIVEMALPTSSYLDRLVGFMYSQDSWTMTPYILYVLKNQSNVNERNSIFRYLETYLVRRTFCRSKNNNYSDLFSENLIGNEILTFRDFKDYVNDANGRGALLMPSDDDLKKAIQSEDQKRNAAVLLYMLESKTNNGFVDGEDGKYNNGFIDFVSESLMPEKDNESWSDNSCPKEERESLVKTIGNFILLREKLTDAVKKSDWVAKKKVMKSKADGIQTSIVVTRDLKAWTEGCIVRRNTMIADAAIKAWPI